VRPVAVFDTNVLFSALGWKGRPFQCLELARTGRVEGVTCRELLDELADKLQTKASLSAELTVETIADLLTCLRVVPISGQVKAVAADPDDDVVLDCALAAAATHVVTGDRRHLLPMGSFRGIAIVTPADFLTAVESTEAPPTGA
jgi:putative PIN family toxin of toxin-antitoxin system